MTALPETLAYAIPAASDHFSLSSKAWVLPRTIQKVQK